MTSESQGQPSLATSTGAPEATGPISTSNLQVTPSVPRTPSTPPFLLGDAALEAVRHEAGKSPEEVANAIAADENLTPAALAPKDRARRELERTFSPDLELTRRFTETAAKCFSEVNGVLEVSNNAGRRKLETSNQITALEDEAASLTETRNRVSVRKTGLNAILLHYSGTKSQLESLLLLPSEQRSALSGQLSIPEKSIELLGFSTTEAILNLDDETLRYSLELVENEINGLGDKISAADTEITEREAQITEITNRTEIEKGVARAYEMLEAQTASTFDTVAKRVREANDKQKAFSNAAKEYSRAEAAIITEFGPDVLTSQDALYDAMEALTGNPAGVARVAKNLRLQIDQAVAFLSIATIPVQGSSEEPPLTPAQIEAEEAKIANMRARLANIEGIENAVARQPEDIIGQFGIDRGTLSTEQQSKLEVLLIDLATRMETKIAAREELEIAIQDIELITRRTKTYNEEIRAAMENTRTEIEALRVETERAAAEAAAAEAAAATAEEERRRVQAVQNAPEYIALQTENERKIRELVEENAALAASAGEGAKAKVKRRVGGFLRSMWNKLPKVDIKWQS